jgi:hypothetical protein
MSQPAKPPTFSVVRTEVWRALSRRLDAVVAEDRVLRLVRDSALRPLQLLDAMAADAPAALGDDFLAAERLRALLHLAMPWRGLPAEAAQLAGSGPAAQPYQPGVLHHGKLVIVALAAIRVAGPDAASDFLATVHGLALALSAGEVFGRLEPGAPESPVLETMLRTLVGLGDLGGTPSPNLLRPFASDAVERGRWASLRELFGADALGSFVREQLQAASDGQVLWDAAHADGITSIEPASALPGARILLRGHFDAALAAKKTKDGHASQVVFVTPSQALHAAEIEKRTKTHLSVVVPDASGEGWIGFSDPARIASSNRYRKSVRDFWSRLMLPVVGTRPSGFLACLREAPVPTDHIPNLGDGSTAALSMPPRTAFNRFEIKRASAATDALGTTRASAATDALGTTRASAAASSSGSQPRAEILLMQPGLDAPFLAEHSVAARVSFSSGGAPVTRLVLSVEGAAERFTQHPPPGSNLANFDIPARLVTADQLRVSLDMYISGDDVPVLSVTTDEFAVVLAKVLTIEVTQHGKPAPLFASQALDVLLTFDPGRTKPEPTLAFANGEILAALDGTSTTARFTIAAERVQGAEIRFAAQLNAFERVLDERQFASKLSELVLAITDVVATQAGDGPPFQAFVPLQCQVSYTPSDVSASVSLVIPGSPPLMATDATAGQASFEIPAAQLGPGELSFEVQLRAPDDSDGRVRDRRALGPFRVLVQTSVDVVLFRPFILRPSSAKRVDEATRDGLFAKFGQGLGLDIALHELPWVDDALAVIASDVLSPDDPRIPLLFESLSRTAAVTPGFEAALWVVLVPTLEDAAGGGQPTTGAHAAPALRSTLRPQRTGLVTYTLAEAALAVAVCDVDGLPQLLAAAAKLAPGAKDSGTLSAAEPPRAASLPVLSPARTATTRLRLLGKLREDGGVELEAAREEPARVAGPGAPYDTGLVAVALDADARPLQRLAIKTVRRSEDAGFVLLFPVSPDVQAIQIRDERGLVAMLRRTAGVPELGELAVDAEAPRLHWTYTHSKVAKPVLQFEVVAEAATFAFSADACAREYLFPTHRLPSGRSLEVRLVASDGWNQAVSSTVAIESFGPTLILRRVTGGQWYADTELVGPFEWTLDGRKLTALEVEGRVARVDNAARGLLQVACRDAAHALVADSRVLGDAADG